jgi:hypothetical protein
MGERRQVGMGTPAATTGRYGDTGGDDEVALRCRPLRGDVECGSKVCGRFGVVFAAKDLVMGKVVWAMWCANL